MNLEFSHVDGVRETMAVMSGNSVLNPNLIYLGADGFSNAIGRRRRRKKRSGTLASKVGMDSASRQKRKTRRRDVVDRLLTDREKSTETQRKALTEAAKTDPTSTQLAATLSATPGAATPPAAEGMPKGMKTGLIIGAVVLVGVLGYAIYKYTKKK